MATNSAYFSTGQNEMVGENTKWMGNGWWNPDEDYVRFPVGPETHVVVESDGRTKVYHENERVW